MSLQFLAIRIPLLDYKIHSPTNSIVTITSIVVAATASAISAKFGAFSKIGSIIGTSVSAGFLLILGVLNIWICYKLARQLRKVIRKGLGEGEGEFRIEGGGCLMWIFRWGFRLVDRYGYFILSPFIFVQRGRVWFF